MAMSHGSRTEPATVPTEPSPRSTPPAGRRRGARTGVLAWASGFIAPAYGFYLLFLIVPLVFTIVLSFTSWDGFDFGSISFNGVANYRELVHDQVFREALVHNVWFLLGSMVIKTLLALALALALYRKFAGSGFFQAVFLVPSVLSLIVVGLVFEFILDPNNGLINPLLRSVGLGGLAGVWFGDPHRALPILVLLDVWVAFGIYMFIFLSSLANLPADVSEAARIDGANGWQETVHVTVPMLASTVKMVLLLSAIDSLKVFATVYVTTDGGPNHASEVLSTWAFFQAFTNNRVGYGNAILVVLLLVTFVLSFFYARHLRAERSGGTR
jgi:raffinose/stachyose/melibiose transport system permease protein